MLVDVETPNKHLLSIDIMNIIHRIQIYVSLDGTTPVGVLFSNLLFFIEKNLKLSNI